MKRYLVISGDDYYPESGAGYWVGCYETLDEAKAVADEKVSGEEDSKWHQIIDLMGWMK